MKDNTSLAKIDANKRNALMSTGPKTPEGKAAIKWNALKHGLLAKEVLIRTGDGKESRQEFQAVLEALIADLKPVGALEGMLVEKIAACYWRLRRLFRTETGEIRAALDTYTFDRAIQQTQTVNELLEKQLWDQKGQEKQLLLSVPGIQTLLRCVEKLRQDVQERGAFCDDDSKQINRLFGSENYTFGGNLLMYDWLASEEGQAGENSLDEDDEEGMELPESVPEPDKCREIILAMLVEKEESLRNALDVMGEREDLKTRSGIARQSVPSAGAAERLLRYETSIERSLYRTLHELQRLQATRSGCAAPQPVLVESDE